MRSITLLFSTIALAACGASKAPSGSPATTAEAPEWVHQGSRVEQGRIYGVGMVGGVRNTELARTTATNRARNEIAKILEVYSASLMKDYQESVTAGTATDDAQLVSQAIKTFTAQLIEGSEVEGYWLDPGSNIWYGLVVLDFGRQREVAQAKAEMPGTVKKWIEENSDEALGDLEKEPARPPANEPPPAEEQAEAPPPAPPAPPPAPPSKPAPPTRQGGEPPAWTKGKNAGGACDSNLFLCGVGSGKAVDSADIAARAELARIFQANIKSVQTSFEGSARKISSATGEQWIEAQKVTNYSMVSTDKVVRMSEIRERWQDAKNTFWTLAVIDRAQAGNALREQIEEKDQAIGSEVAAAQNESDKLKRFRSLRRAVDALVEREALNSDLRVIEKSGKGIPPPHDIGEILNLLEGAASDLKIGVALAGSGADRVQACLEEGLTGKGYQVEANSQEEEDEDPDISGRFDVLIKGNVKGEKRGAIAGSEVVNLVLTIKLINGSNNKVVKTITATKKASRGDVKSAAATAAHQMCTQKMGEVIAGIDQYFGKKR